MTLRCFTLLALFTIAFLIGCGKMAMMVPESITDTPENNYNNGMRALKVGDHKGAIRSFNRAKELDSNFAPAYEGIGLVHLVQNQLEDAEKSFKESLKKDDEYAPAYVGVGRVYLAQEKYAKARGRFDKAMKVDPKNVDARYYKGRSYMAEQEFSDARKWFRDALDLDNTHAEANRAWEKVDRIERAMPGTELGKKIALQDEITRADLCALFIEELKLDRAFRHTLRKNSGVMVASALNPPELTDVNGHWAEQYIRPLVKLGVFTPYPDHTFRPQEPVRRRDYAIAVQNTLTAILGEKELRTMFIGSNTAFRDLPSSHFAYNAALLVTTRGILAADVETGEFRPMETISGAQALLGLREMMRLLP